MNRVHPRSRKMANIARRVGDATKHIKIFTKTKVVPTSKMIVATVGPPVKTSTKFLARTLGPPVSRSTKYVLGVARPHAKRYTDAVYSKVQPTIANVQDMVSRTVATVTPEFVRNYQTRGLIEGLEEEDEDMYRERYIPITRRSIIRHLMEKKDFLTTEEQKYFENFAQSLDSAIVNQYHGVLQELKHLFDPINPDKDTMETRQWNPRERQDNEFWLLQRLDDIMESANFHELPQAVVDKAMREHKVGDGVRVSVDTSKYDVLKFWALGKEKVPVTLPWYKSMFLKKNEIPKPKTYYKRVVVAIRLKRDQKLLLKSFKEIPVNNLEMLVPEGKIKIDKLDKGIIGVSVTLALVGVIAKIVTVLAALNVDFTLIATAAGGIVAARGWNMYKNKRNHYLVDLSRLLYFKNVANNRGLLALLVDRAEDESFKEALLVYSFLLANRSRSSYDARSVEMSPEDLGGLNALTLEKSIEEWIKKISGTEIEFESKEAIHLLKKFGIVSEDEGKFHVLPLKAAWRNLPQQPQSLVARVLEADLEEGYDRDVFLETEEQYEKGDKLQKRIGWF